MSRPTLTAAIVGVAICSSASAATFTVNTPVDAIDATPGNGVCNPLGLAPGLCTLRAAVMEANALAGTDNIVLTANQAYVLTLAGQEDSAVAGDLDITESVSIRFFGNEGDRPLVNAGGLERAFEIHNGTVTLRGFDIFGGAAIAPGDAHGGGVAINFNADNVTISRMRMFGNRARFGGALANDGPNTTVKDSVFYANAFGGEGIRAGTAIYNRGTMTLDASAVYLNEGFNGGLGPAIEVAPGGPGLGRFTALNSTISSNHGIGIHTTDANLITLKNVTIAGNEGYGLWFGGINTSLVMYNTIIARNAVDCALTQAESADYDTNAFNLDSDGTCGLEAGISNHPQTDPMLTPLKRRGGLSPAHWPRLDSQAVDFGHPIEPTGELTTCLPVDQHNTSRPQQIGIDRCDVGAIEVPEDAIFYDSLETI